MTPTKPHYGTPDQRGRAFEDLIRWRNNVYQAHGEARIEKYELQAIIRGGKPVLMKSFPDFGGPVTCMGGRYMCFDAKMTASLTYRHHREQLHQLSQLWEMDQAGAIAFLFISYNLERFFLVWPQPDWGMQRWKNVKLHMMQPTEGVEIDRGGGYDLPDYIEAIRWFSERKAA